MSEFVVTIALLLASEAAWANRAIPSFVVLPSSEIVLSQSSTPNSSPDRAHSSSQTRFNPGHASWRQAQYTIQDFHEISESSAACDGELPNPVDIAEAGPDMPASYHTSACPYLTPVSRVSPDTHAYPVRVQWRPLFEASMRYLGMMHAFRLATEAGTRDGLHGNVIGGYFKALGAMHGWSDGDGFYENYLGHPIEGAVSSYIWINHDPRYGYVEFGKNPDYWKSRLRAYAYSWAFSEQFEIGPISEASIGQIQRFCCEYGFVDHIITPNLGLGWVVGEDILDKYVVRRIEDSSPNRAIRIAARIILNPVQSFANIMSWRYPWHRVNRESPSHYSGSLYAFPVQKQQQIGRFEVSTVPKLEIAATVPSVLQIAGLSCLGGGAVAGMRLNDQWQWTLEVSGCTFGQSLPKNWSGDSLTFTTGPQWIRHTASRWAPHMHIRVGGQKITKQLTDPEKRKQIQDNLPAGDDLNPYYDSFTTNYESTGFSVSIGTGIDYRVHPGMALRLASFDYVHSWLSDVNQTNLNRGFRFTTGVVLRLGTW